MGAYIRRLDHPNPMPPPLIPPSPLARLVPTLIDNIPMGYHCGSNGIWAETAIISRSHVFHRDLQIREPSSNVVGSLSKMSRYPK